MTRQEWARQLNAPRSEERRSRIDDYLFIGGDRMPARLAAARLGVSERTIIRYRRELRQGVAPDA